MTCVLRRALSILSILFMAGSAHGEESGALRGRFVVDGAVPRQPIITQNVAAGVVVVDETVVVGPNGGLKNVVIYLRTKDVPVAARFFEKAGEEVTVELKNLRFEPHVLFLLSSQTLKLKNLDGIGHNPKANAIINAGWNLALAAGQITEQKLASEEPLPIQLNDSICPWMRAWIVVRDSPHAAISADDGKFIIRDLPAAAELEFQLWHEQPGYLKTVAFKGGQTDRKGRFKITIQPGDNDLGDIRVPTAMLRK